MINLHPVPAFKDNYIWLVGRSDSPYVAVVDPGDAAPVLEALARLSLVPLAILITHHHRDHVGGITELLGRYSIPVYGPARERIPSLSHPISEGDRVSLPEMGIEFDVLDVPGHTLGAIAYHGHGLLFCGDTLFTGGCGRLFEGTAAQMHASLAKIAALPADTRVYCGHEYTLANLRFAEIVEPSNIDLQTRMAETKRLRSQGLPTVPSTLDVELTTNPFLRSHIPSVAAAAEHFAARTLSGGVEVFATVRNWKDALDD